MQFPEQFPPADLERVFLSVRDLFHSPDLKVHTILQKFILSFLKPYPFLLEAQGSRIFKYVKDLKDSDISNKLRVFFAGYFML